VEAEEEHSLLEIWKWKIKTWQSYSKF